MLVMYAGEIVEEGTTEQVFRRPLHPYTQALVKLSQASLTTARQRLPAIEGEPPDATQLPAGCAFQPRCRERMEICGEHRPSLSPAESGRQVSCFKYE
jgi:oligopeptide/dipeptide ABC transporter ATP-binding protein